MDDDFGAIVDGIKEGRLIFANLKKCITYVMSSNVPEIVPFLVFILFKLPLGLETIMILLIDLGTDLAPTISLAYEEPEDQIMKIPPRTSKDHLISWRVMLIAYGTIGVFETCAAYFAFFQVFFAHGFTMDMLVGSGIQYRTDFDKLTHER
jgi:sodium/potassium-transporting ATPase subunit alpha